MRSAFTSCLLLCLVLGPSPVRADGMVFHERGGSLSVEATAQRAVVWLRDATWEIHIQPEFLRAQGGAAWVVPFPVRPEIHTGDAGFFDELELLTAPVFLQYCTEARCGDGNYNSNLTASLRGGQSPVTVWERGKVGELQYVILSAADGESLTGWLDEHDYALPEGAASLVNGFETEGLWFFAARLDPELDPAWPLAPVRFVLPSLDSPLYPLRLTRLGAPAQGRFELTLWIVTPDGEGWEPASHGWARLSGEPTSPALHAASVDTFFAETSPDTLLLQYRGSVAQTLHMEARCSSRSDLCLPLAQMGITVPDAWAPELLEVGASWGTEGQRYVVSRYIGRLDAAAMSADLTFRRADFGSLRDDNVWLVPVGDCTPCPPDAVSCSTATAPRAWLLIVALLGLLLLASWRRRRNR